MNLDEDEIAIIDYVRNHSGTTQNKIVNEMNKGQCSTMTTVKKIKSLIVRGVLEDGKGKPNSFHSFFINDKNKFNQINSALDNINSLIDETYEMANMMFLPSKKSDYENNANALSKLAAMYKNTFTNMLETLLVEVNRDIISSKDSQLLYNRIIVSMLKMAEFNLIINSVWNPILLDAQMINASLDEWLSDKAFLSYVKKEGFNVNLFRSYITKINRYYMNFNETFPNNRYFLADNWTLRSKWPADR